MQERKPNEKLNEQFNKVNEKLDQVFIKDGNQAKQRSKIELKPKTFMKISDVDVEDARKFKEFCDKHVQGKQFLGIKVMMAIVGKLDPLVTNILEQINQLNNRMNGYETILEQVMKQPDEDQGLQIPQTQGKKARERRIEKEKKVIEKELEAEK